MTQEAVVLLLAWIKPLAYLVGMAAILLIAVLWLFRDVVWNIFNRIIFRKTNQDQSMHYHKRSNDPLLMELVRVYKETSVAIVKISETMATLVAFIRDHEAREERMNQRIHDRVDDIARRAG